MEENVDTTIEALCSWIQKTLGSDLDNEKFGVVPEMTRALAELVSARAKFDYET